MSHTIPNFGIYTPTALYEANYRRLLRLWPELRELQHQQLISLTGSRLMIEIKEQFKYTTTIILKQPLQSMTKHFNSIEMELRACHDACLVEVIGYQGETPINSATHYPNQKMFQKDEKKQLNLLLKEILVNAIKIEKYSTNMKTCC